jgi:hypothetical protein
LAQGEKLAAAAFDGELDAGVAHEALEVFVLLRIHVLGGGKFLLGLLERGFDGVLIDFLLGDRVFGEDAHAVAVDLGEAAADREERRGRALGDTWVSSGMWPGRIPISP